jgi:hypothetical protein
MAKEGDKSDNLSLSYGDYGKAFRKPKKNRLKSPY